MTTDTSSLTPLTIPGLATPLPFDGTGLTGPVDPDTIRAALPSLRRVGAAVRWLQGDLVLAIVDRDTSRLHEAWQMIGDLDLDDRPSLMRSIAVAYAIPRERRRSSLSWSHHQAVAGLEPDEQERWLERAESGSLTVNALERQIADELAPEPDEPLFPAPKQFKLPAADLVRIAAAFEADPDCAVVIRADGTWRVLAVPA